MTYTFIALLMLGQATSPTWQTFTCTGGNCTFYIKNGVPGLDATTEPTWNYLPVLCMTGPRLLSEANSKDVREFSPVCEQFDYDNDGDLDLRDFAKLQRRVR